MTTQTVTLMGQTATITPDRTAVAQHMRETGMTREQAERTEAVVTFAAQLVEKQCRRYGAAAGNALSIKLEAVVMDQLLALHQPTGSTR